MHTNPKVENIIESKTKCIVVTGGVCSSIGKGVLVSSIGVLLKNAGYSICVVKWDPYLNVDPGTMSPLEHGEVFVTADGAETDLDLGHYERMMQLHLSRTSSVSSGQIFEEIIEGERKGKYLGKCIQLIPHVVDAIKQRLYNFAQEKQTDFVLLEIGGTVGDIEGNIFLEAIRQARLELGAQRLMHFHLSLVPFLSWANEIKTKPTQHSMHVLKGLGLIPDSLVLRTDKAIEQKTFQKLSIMCGVDSEYIFQVPTCSPIYQLFFELEKQQLCEKIQTYFGITKPRATNLSTWQNLLDHIKQSSNQVRVGLVAKYVGSNDPYLSVIEALTSAGYWSKTKVYVEIIDAEKLEKEGLATQEQTLKNLDGIIVPGGFDKRGVEGKIAAAQYARTHRIPFLGLCLGMQIMLIEYARSVLGFMDANSTEFDPNTSHPVISLLEEQHGIDRKGATMRLGAYPCKITENTKAFAAYKKSLIEERHRHRYEFNNKYRAQFQNADVLFSGIYAKKDLVEIAELKNHPFMLGTQAHPEFNSSPLQVNPLFSAFVQAVIGTKKGSSAVTAGSNAD